MLKDRMQLLYIHSHFNLMPKHLVTKLFKSGMHPARTGKGESVLIPMVMVWGATVDQVHNHSELVEQYSVEYAKQCPWKSSGTLL